MTLIFLIGYLILLLILGIFAKKRAKPGHEDFFLASRQFGPLVLFFTLAATNFSSFTIFGFAGAGYRFGYSYYPIMAFGTGFMALTFLLIGVPAWRAGKKNRAITPPELIRLRFKNPALHLTYLMVMVVFTLPYLALQPMGAGYMLQSLLGVPYQFGVLLVGFVGLGYLLLSGVRGDAWTDIIQGTIMILGLALIFSFALWRLGGFVKAHTRLLEAAPELFSRPGRGEYFTPKIWFSYLALWFLCDPMFPQLFQRFFAAKNEHSLKLAALLYPLITGLLFFFPVSLGVLSHLVLSGLDGTKTDAVLPLLVGKTLPPVLGGVMSISGIAALMSTMDSQLLTLTSMLIRDIRLVMGKPPETKPLVQFGVTSILTLFGIALALRPWGTILEIATETFTGLAVLFPLTFAACYWKQANPWAGLVSIILGEVLVILYHYKLLPTFGFLPVIPIVLVSSFVLIIGSLFFPACGLYPWGEMTLKNWRWGVIFTLIFLLSLDFYNWNRVKPVLFAFPFWLLLHFAIILLLFFALLFYIQNPKRGKRIKSASFFESLPRGHGGKPCD